MTGAAVVGLRCRHEFEGALAATLWRAARTTLNRFRRTNTKGPDVGALVGATLRPGGNRREVKESGHYLHGVSSSCGPARVTSANYDVTADGEHFIMIDDKTQDVVGRQVNVVLGWAGELKRAAQSRN